MEEFYAMPGHLIRRAQQVSTALFTDECAVFDLTALQYAPLCVIESNPDVDATRLSSLIAFDRSTIGDVVERMEAYRTQRVLRTARVQLLSRAIGEHVYHPSGVHAQLRNAIMGAKTPADWYEDLAWLYGENK
jgi:hypothetical protein